MTHSVSITGVSRPRSGYVAACGCGWKTSALIAHTTATKRAAAHIEKAEAQDGQPNQAAMAMTPAERKAKQRAEALAAGKCYGCCKRKRAANSNYCRTCIADGAERRQRSRERTKI